MKLPEPGNDMNDNKLIAEFMGYELCMNYYIPEHEKPCNYGDGMTNAFFPEELEYHSSWDWLMPVINAIAFKYSTEFIKGSIFLELPEKHFGHIKLYSTLPIIYKAVVEFIKWYNKLEK